MKVPGVQAQNKKNKTSKGRILNSTEGGQCLVGELGRLSLLWYPEVDLGIKIPVLVENVPRTKTLRSLGGLGQGREGDHTSVCC